jgi:hypothetical protein
MWRPHLIRRGRSSRSWIQRVSAGVADQQRSPVAVVDRLLLGRLVVGGAEVVEPQVAVRVDQPGHDPALGSSVGTGLGLVGDPAVDDVEVACLTVGEDRAAEALRTHAPTLAIMADAARRADDSHKWGTWPDRR